MFKAFLDTIKGGISFGISASLVKAVGIILIPIYTRQLAMEEYGVLGLLVLMSLVCDGIFTLGLGSALFRSYYDYDEKKERSVVISTALILATISAAILGTLSLVFGKSVVAEMLFDLPQYGSHFQLMMVGASVGILKIIPFSVYRAQKKFLRYAVYNFFFAFLQVLIILYLVLEQGMGLFGVVLGMVISKAVTSAVLLVAIRQEIKFAFSRPEALKLLKYGLPLVVVSLTGIVTSSGGLYFMQKTADLAEVGVFNLALKLTMIFHILIMNPFQIIWPPTMFAVEKNSYAEAFYSRMLTYVSYLGMLVALGIGLFAREVILLLATPEYERGTVVVFVLTTSSLILAIKLVFHVGIALKRRTELLSMISVLQAFVCIGIWIIFVPRFGLLGAAFGPLFGYLLGAILAYWFSSRLVEIDYEWKRVGSLGGLYLLLYSISIIFTAPEGLMNICIKLGLLSLFIVLPLLTGFWRAEELSILQRSIVGLKQYLSNSGKV